MNSKNRKTSTIVQNLLSPGNISTTSASGDQPIPTVQRGSLSLNVGSLTRSFSRSSFMIRQKLSNASSGNGKDSGGGGVIGAIKKFSPEMPLEYPGRLNIRIPNVRRRLSHFMIEELKLHSDRGGDGNSPGVADPLISQHLLEGYSDEELSEYRQVFNIFDSDRSGAIAIDELETAIKNLGLEQTRDELYKIIDEVDQRGNHQIDFDEFCVVMRRLTMKKSSWNEVVKECFTVFDRSENGGISKRDFRYILREFGDITDNQIIDEIFNEADVDGNGVIDYDEFTYMVKNYMTDDDI
ncbi:unnamed protein product [Caenorhabditis angaria]|uniref:EF-hand domain-containing protein n=1 Tax=Caenorhabditis angaria TaxID=860376 RepID=A0A9P1N7Q6_9PELO|nr:unnamed protein product [Caenorhabditis angaria]